MSSSVAGDQPDVRRRLLEEAARILGEEGPSALSVRRLATGAGTSTMAVYTYFGAMSAVVDAVATEGFRRLIDHVDAVATTADPLDDLRRMAVAYRDNALENRHLYGVMFGAVHVGGLGGRGLCAVAALSSDWGSAAAGTRSACGRSCRCRRTPPIRTPSARLPGTSCAPFSPAARTRPMPGLRSDTRSRGWPRSAAATLSGMWPTSWPPSWPRPAP